MLAIVKTIFYIWLAILLAKAAVFTGLLLLATLTS